MRRGASAGVWKIEDITIVDSNGVSLEAAFTDGALRTTEREGATWVIAANPVELMVAIAKYLEVESFDARDQE